jgi:hypothetical protein
MREEFFLNVVTTTGDTRNITALETKSLAISDAFLILI